MWKQPWGYAEGWLICCGLFLTGLILQFTTGKVDADYFRYPLNLIGTGLFLILLGILQFRGRKKNSLRWFSGLKATLTSLTSVIVLLIIMGLTRQVSPSADLSGAGGFSRTGFMQMTSSWPFVLLFLYLLGILGLVTLRRLSSFRGKDIGFALNHAGLFIALTAAIAGSGDLQKLRMSASYDAPEWRGIDDNNQLHELPVAIELQSFTIDEYPPKLMVIDNQQGIALPEGRPVNIVADSAGVGGKLLEWDIEVTQSLPMAAGFFQADTVSYVEFHSVGATTALYIKAVNRTNGRLREGWVSCGNHMFPYSSLRLSDSQSIIMPDREPRRYASEVTVYTEKGDIREAVIEVNKPLKVDGWKIYQISYDEHQGKWSSYSVFELVKDPWLPVVYLGIYMMIAGALFLFLSPPKTN